VNEKSPGDIGITGILAFIWFVAVAGTLAVRDNIPVYLLGIATVFFLMLLPTMKELVTSLERRAGGDRSAVDE
jgi:hypothetical protein